MAEPAEVIGSSAYHHHRPWPPVEVKRRVLVPFDRPVWLECQALVSAGYRVAVVCPKGSGDPVTIAVSQSLTSRCPDRA